MYPKIRIPVCSEPTLLSKMARYDMHSLSSCIWKPDGVGQYSTPATLSVGSEISAVELNPTDARVDYTSLPASSPNLVNEDAEPVCVRCNLVFPDITSFNDHLTNTIYHHWCFICSRDFQSSTAFSQHNVSLAHKNRDLKCPFCEELFKSPSGVAFHIESGCHGVNRRQVTAAIHSLHIIPTISVSHRIEGASIQTEPVDTTITTLIATEDSFDVLTSSYVCTICAHQFTSLRALNTHLNSPAHDDKEFKCPKAKCGREFKLISGFVQHVESGVCGASKMKGIEQYYEDLTAAFTRALTM
ncbi:hypothetical protein BDN71DRAFT_617978 [Pleurotus eryngii]|uniref:C2H2-type domain-containing protein n=1 Tax=Pleurotus eryngii TaxID=5323 RepID=A0A9P6D0H5_PLEER|nr:hypothetical protein BDN71DRAFT_617978 [Pleurotus eryngii]